MNLEQIYELTETAKKLGVKTERNRIMKEILEADLPKGIWPLIENIISPKT